MQKNTNDIIPFLIVVSALIALLVGFITFMFVSYRKRQNNYQNNLEQIQLDHEKTLLSSQLEIQEQTFQHVSREIHDNINLSLTLAKLNLNTVDLQSSNIALTKIENSIELISKSIIELSNISKSLNSDFFEQQGLVKAIEDEVGRIRQAGAYCVAYSVTGNPIFLNAQKELIIFRIIQEAFNNIIKHANANSFQLIIHYGESDLLINILDSGNGFDTKTSIANSHAGLKNMQTRSKILGGTMDIKSEIGNGTSLTFNIPYQNNEN